MTGAVPVIVAVPVATAVAAVHCTRIVHEAPGANVEITENGATGQLGGLNAPVLVRKNGAVTVPPVTVTPVNVNVVMPLFDTTRSRVVVPELTTTLLKLS